MSTATEELINAYLADLEREAARLPWNARTELLEDVRSHIEVAVAELREAARGRGGGRAGSGAGAADAWPADAERGDAAGFGIATAGGDAGSGAGVAAAGSADAERDDAAPSAGMASALPSGTSAWSPRTPLSGSPPTDELSQVRAMLSALGDPSEIVAAALTDNQPLPAQPPYPTRDLYPADPDTYRPPTSQSPPYPLSTADTAAVTLLLVGGFLAGIGWLVGVVLLWTSTRWTRLEKLIGTLILPGGLAGVLAVAQTPTSTSSTICSSGGGCTTVHSGWTPPLWLGIAMLAFLVLAPIATTVFLVTRARRRPGVASGSRASLAIIAGVGTFGLLALVGVVFAVGGSSGSSGTVNPVPVVSYGTPPPGSVVPVSSPAQSASTR